MKTKKSYSSNSSSKSKSRRNVSNSKKNKSKFPTTLYKPNFIHQIDLLFLPYNPILIPNHCC